MPSPKARGRPNSASATGIEEPDADGTFFHTIDHPPPPGPEQPRYYTSNSNPGPIQTKTSALRASRAKQAMAVIAPTESVTSEAYVKFFADKDHAQAAAKFDATVETLYERTPRGKPDAEVVLEKAQIASVPGPASSAVDIEPPRSARSPHPTVHIPSDTPHYALPIRDSGQYWLPNNAERISYAFSPYYFGNNRISALPDFFFSKAKPMSPRSRTTEPTTLASTSSYLYRSGEFPPSSPRLRHHSPSRSTTSPTQSPVSPRSPRVPASTTALPPLEVVRTLSPALRTSSPQRASGSVSARGVTIKQLPLSNMIVADGEREKARTAREMMSSAGSSHKSGAQTSRSGSRPTTRSSATTGRSRPSTQVPQTRIEKLSSSLPQPRQMSFAEKVRSEVRTDFTEKKVSASGGPFSAAMVSTLHQKLDELLAELSVRAPHMSRSKIISETFDILDGVMHQVAMSSYSKSSEYFELFESLRQYGQSLFEASKQKPVSTSG